MPPPLHPLPAGQLGPRALKAIVGISCVVLCVVTLPSLPVSERFARCRTGTGKGREDTSDPHGHCPSMLVRLLWYRPISDRFEI
jgi:hypothetical protein